MLIQKVGKNDKGRDFVVGDIHGAFHVLDKKLKKIGFNDSTDRLFSVGDMIDRGPFPEAALEYIQEDWFYPVLGNHELMLMEWHAGLQSKVGGAWSWMGSVKMMDVNGSRWGEKANLQPYYDAFIKLPVAMTIDRGDTTIGIAHADPLATQVTWDKMIDKLAKMDDTIDTRLNSLVCTRLTWCRNTRDLLTYLTYGVGGKSTENDVTVLTEEQVSKKFTMGGVTAVYVGHTPHLHKVLSVGNIHYVDQGSPWLDREGSDLTVLEI